MKEISEEDAGFMPLELSCYYCAIGYCGHQNCRGRPFEASVEGTSLCLDCACAERKRVIIQGWQQEQDIPRFGADENDMDEQEVRDGC